MQNSTTNDIISYNLDFWQSKRKTFARFHKNFIINKRPIKF